MFTGDGAPTPHLDGCPSRTGGPKGGDGWLTGLGHCDLAYGDNRHRRCAWCGMTVPARRSRWCSDRCDRAYGANHAWNAARWEALQRAGNTCERCGRGSRPRILLNLLWAATNTTPPAFGSPELSEWYRWVHVALEVNHVTPIRGRHAEFGCHHHQAGLEVLCVDCHREETRAQRARGWTARPDGWSPPPPVEQLPLVP